ncbi:MAG: hypothetical protein RIT43_1392 [Bacteroidota bacterium]|jgi:hypothetical protein
MNRILAICIVLVSAWNVSAQKDDEREGSKPGILWNFTGLRPAKAGKAMKYDRLVFDVTYNDWLGELRSFQNQWSSIGLNTNLMFDFPLNKKSTVSFGTGVRHSLFRTENLSNLFVCDPTGSYTQIKEGTASAKRILLCGNSLGIPLEFRFRTKGRDHFKFQFGFTPAYQLNIYSKTVFSNGNVSKDYHFVDLNRFALSGHIRFGIRNWAIYGACSINPLFYSRASATLHLLQLGLSVSLF